MQADTPILFVVGFAMQYLRGFRWFTDLHTLIVALLAGALASWLEHEHQAPREWVLSSINYVPTVLGGTLGAHMLAQRTELVPKFNSYSKEAGK
jgi:hypothetical protein